MAHFYGKMKGNRGEVTRCGDRHSGLKATIASWEGAIEVELYHQQGVDCATITLVPWGQQHFAPKVLYEGRLRDAAHGGERNDGV
jgi:hypothetical protein